MNDEPYPSSLTYQVLYNECRGCGDVELLAVWGVIQNRSKNPKFPEELDSVLLQPYQFSTHFNKLYTKPFKQRVDTLIKKPYNHTFLYFANLKMVKNRNIVRRIKSYKPIQIGIQHFY